MRSTLLELECEPLNMLITLSALALATFAGALHYHQFGEVDRMAREAGLSAILVPGVIMAVLSSVRVFAREMESLTMHMALSHSISRSKFLVSKFFGVAAAHAIFFLAVWANSLVAVNGSLIGAANANGDIARVWGPSLAWGVAAIASPLVIGAAANRFLRWRFTRTVTLSALAISLAGVCYRFNAPLALRHLACAIPILPATWAFAAIAMSLATRLKPGAATSCTFAIAALSLPLLGAHYIPDAFSAAAKTPCAAYFILAFVSPVLICAAALTAGCHLLNNKDLQ